MSMPYVPTDPQSSFAEELTAVERERDSWRWGFRVILVTSLLVLVANYGMYFSHVGIYKIRVTQSATYTSNVTICGYLSTSQQGQATAYLTTHGLVVIPDSLSSGIIPTGTAINVTYQNALDGPYEGYFVATGLAPATSATPSCNVTA